jgi:hypothetical protein
MHRIQAGVRPTAASYQQRDPLIGIAGSAIRQADRIANRSVFSGTRFAALAFTGDDGIVVVRR